MKIAYQKPDIRIKRLSMDNTILAGSDGPSTNPKGPGEGPGDENVNNPQLSKRAVFGNDFDTDHDTDTIPRFRSLWDD